MNSIEKIAREMLLFDNHPKIQTAQTAMRQQLVDAWAIPSGASVLEIGCGQGDLTAVLADVVGLDGCVVAVDSAGPDYGAPVTIGDSTAHLAISRYAEILEFRLKYDVLENTEALSEGGFDYVVLAHSSWYFNSVTKLHQIINAAHKWAPILCISDWDLCPKGPEQFAHMLAVLLHSQVESYRVASEANIRSPYALPWLRESLTNYGWHEEGCAYIECAELYDGLWEIESFLSKRNERAIELGIPCPVQSLVRQGTDVLAEVVTRFGTSSLSSFAIRATSANSAVLRTS